MSLTLSLVLIGVSLALTVFCAWRGARPAAPMRGPRLIPWRLLMVLFTFAAIVFLVQAVRAALGVG